MGNKAFNDALRMIIKLMRRVSTDKSAGGPNPYAVLAADAGIKMMHNLTGNDSFDKIIVQFKIIKNMPGFKIKFHKDAEHHTLLNFVTTVGGPIIKSRVKSVMAQEGTKLAELVKTQLNELFVRVNHTRVAERMSDAKTVVKDSDFNKHMKAENKEPTTSS